ncbi:MAG: hypothetical protein ABII26_09190 [Pseudomonadota bacterium]
MTKKYRVVFMGLLKDEEDFKHNMSRLGVSPETAELIIRRAPIVLQGNMTLGNARQYAEAIQDAGGRVKLHEHGFFEEADKISNPMPIKSFESFVMCPQCGCKQLKAEICIKCGFKLDEPVNG